MIIPDYLARSIIESCRKFYSDPENVKKYEEWKNSKMKKQRQKEIEKLK